MKPGRKLFLARSSLLGILMLTLGGCSDGRQAAACDHLAVDDAWIREAPPGAKVLAGYMKLGNPGGSDVRIVSADSADFDRIEFHRSTMRGGVMKMDRQSELVVPGNGSLSLAPGGYHLMLIAPQEALRHGDEVDMTLNCSSRDRIRFRIPVRRAPTPASGNNAGDADLHVHQQHDHQ